MPRTYYVNEGDHIGGQEAQALGTVNKRITASVAITKGQLVEVTGDWTAGPASDKSAAIIGVAFADAGIGDNVVVECEGFVKLDATAAGITAGNKLVSGGAGKARAYVAETDTAAQVIGLAYNSCNASGVVYTKLTL